MLDASGELDASRPQAWRTAAKPASGRAAELREGPPAWRAGGVATAPDRPSAGPQARPEPRLRACRRATRRSSSRSCRTSTVPAEAAVRGRPSASAATAREDDVMAQPDDTREPVARGRHGRSSPSMSRRAAPPPRRGGGSCRASSAACSAVRSSSGGGGWYAYRARADQAGLGRLDATEAARPRGRQGGVGDAGWQARQARHRGRRLKSAAAGQRGLQRRCSSRSVTEIGPAAGRTTIAALADRLAHDREGQRRSGHQGRAGERTASAPPASR